MVCEFFGFCLDDALEELSLLVGKIAHFFSGALTLDPSNIASFADLVCGLLWLLKSVCSILKIFFSGEVA